MEKRDYDMEFHKENLRRVAFNVPIKRHAELKAWCQEHGTTMQGLIKELLHERTGISFDMKDVRAEQEQ